MSEENLKQQIQLLKEENAKLKQQLGLNEKGTEIYHFWSKGIIDSIPNPVFIKNDKSVYVTVNKAFSKFVDLSEEELIGRNDLEFFPLEQAKIFRDIDANVIATGEMNWNEEEITIEGNLFNLLTSKARILDALGNRYILGVITDITDNKNQLIQLTQKQNELETERQNANNLLKEVHHRVKNNLQVISSLLSLQKQYFQNDLVNKVIEDCSMRIIAMAKVHEILYSTENFSKINFLKYIEKLIESLIQSFKLKEKVNFELDLGLVYLDLSRAIPMGMAINEIITNSIKHAQEDGKTLIINIGMQKSDDQLILTVGDNGGGADIDLTKENSSLGLELIHLLCRQVNAEVDISNTNTGISYTLSLSI